MNDNIFGKLYRQVVLEFYHDNKEGERVVANIDEERKEHFANRTSILTKVQQLTKVMNTLLWIAQRAPLTVC